MMIKKIFTIVFLIALQTFAEGAPTLRSVGIKIFMNDGRVLKGYMGFAGGSFNMGLFEKYQMGSYRYEPPAYIQNYVRKGNDLEDWLNLTNLALENNFEGFEEKIRSSEYEKKKMIIYKEIIPLDHLFKDYKGVSVVPENEVFVADLKDIKKISLDPDLKESIKWDGGLGVYTKEEIELLKNSHCKYRMGFSFDGGSITFYLYKDLKLSQFLKLIDCYSTSEWTPYIFNDARFRHPPQNLKIDISGVSRIKGLSIEEQRILVDYLLKFNQVKLNKSKNFIRENDCRNKNDDDFGALKKNGIVTMKEYDSD